MGLILTLLLGGLAGWIASMLMNRDAEQGVILNIVVGIVGAFVGNLLLEPLFGVPARLNTVSVENFLMSVGGAIVLLGIVNLFQRGRLR